MDVADLSSQSMLACNNLLADDNTSANAGSQRYHYDIIKSFSAALPHLAESRHVGVIAALYRQTAQECAKLFSRIHVVPA